MAKRKRRPRGGKCTVDKTSIKLECWCGAVHIIDRPAGEDTDDILDRGAQGWWTSIRGGAMCPRHVRERLYQGVKMTMPGMKVHGPLGEEIKVPEAS